MLIAAVLLFLMYIFPLWSISLLAPQYPEGLGLYINIGSIDGHKANDLQSINGLNHYIGMKKIEPDSILELKIMPYIVAFFIIMGFINFIYYKKWLVIGWIITFTAAGFIGIYDFWLWEYDYGHNLNPHAIIKIPGMSYQPPLMGSEQLLNFTATSFPHIGGVVIGLSILLAITSLIARKKII